MVRIVGDDNLSDDERVAEIREATGVDETHARELLAKSRDEAPRSDVIVMEGDQFALTATQGVAVLSFSGSVRVAEPTPVREGELVRG